MKKFLKFFGFFVALLFLFIMLAILITPAFLSSDFGKSFVLNSINQRIPGKIEVEHLRLNWLGKQEIRGIKINDPENIAIFSADKVHGDFPLFTFLFNNSLKTLVLQNLNATLATDSEGYTNLEYALTKGANKTPIKFNEPIFLKNINIDLKNSRQGISLQGKGDTLQKGLQGAFTIDAEYGEKRKIQIDASNFPTLFLDQLLAIRYPKFKGILLDFLGEKFNQIKILTEKNTLFFNAESTTAKADIKGLLNSHDFTVFSGSKIHLNLPIANVRKLETYLTPTSPFIGEIALNDLKIPLSKYKLDNLEGTVEIHAEPITFENNFSLHDIEALIEFPSPSKEFTVILKKEGARSQETFSSNLILNFDKKILLSTKLLEENFRFSGKIITQNTPLNLEGVKESGKIRLNFSSENARFPTLNFEINQFCKNHNTLLEGRLVLRELPKGLLNIHEIHVPLKIISDKLTFKWLAYSKEGKTLMNGEGYLKEGIENQSFNLQRLEGEAKFHLFDIDLLNMGHFFKGDSTILLSQEGLLTSNWKLQGTQSSPIKNIEGTLSGDRFNNEITFNMKADNNFFKGAFVHDWSLTPKEVGFEANLQKFPIRALCPLVDSNLCTKIESIFGSHVNGNSHVQMKEENGTLSLVLQGNNGSLNLNGIIRENSLLLKDPLQATVKITRELENSVLKDLLPFLLPITSVKDPIEVLIQPEKFKLPLQQFTLDHLSVGQGQMNFPRITVSQKSELSKAVSLLGFTQDCDVQFTPLYFSLNHSVLNLARMDMLIAQTYPIASWGTIDFNHNKLQMNVALSSAALQKAFGIEKLPKKYMLQIPFHGDLSNPHLDTTKAVTRISALIAQKSGSPQGVVLGTVLDAFTSSLTDSNIPDPTTRPLPWDVEADAEQEKEHDSKEKKNNIFEKPLKSLEKEAKSLVKGLLGN